MSSGKPFPTFQEFFQSLDDATYESFRSLQFAEVESPAAFSEMKAYLQYFYARVEVAHSFVDHAGFIVDCIPYDQQPARRGSKEPAAIPPALPDLPKSYVGHQGHVTKRHPPSLHPNYRDRLGNQMWCPTGTVPIIRTTLEQIARRRTLGDFLRKEPPQSFREEKASRDNSIVADNGHRYATGELRIPNVGGSSYVNIWKPQCFGSQNSLSQQWYTADVQSVECGWQVCPSNWGGDANPRLFVFYTLDGWVTGSFNQHFEHAENVSYHIGMGLLFSTIDGDQYESEMGFFLTNEGWWFRFQGEWLGRFPTSLFTGGPLVSGAQKAAFGGETALFGTFPPMGSGLFPDGGFGKAAYQRNVLVFQPTHAEIPHLSAAADAPNCYRILISNSSPTDWGTFLFFGGPGGMNC